METAEDNQERRERRQAQHGKGEKNSSERFQKELDFQGVFHL